MPVREQPAINMVGLLVLDPRVWETRVMTSLAEAKSKFGQVVGDAGGAIFKVERAPSVGGREEEKLQIGTPDGFVKVAVPLNQPNIDAVLGERTATLVKRAEELRRFSRVILPRPSDEQERRQLVRAR